MTTAVRSSPEGAAFEQTADVFVVFGIAGGVHASLMTGVRNRVDAFLNWGWDYVTKAPGPQVLDRAEVAKIVWDEDVAPDRETAAVP